jgi:aminoglycoside N3'-acetyltransferase
MTGGWDLQSLAADLRVLGVRRGQHLLVHSSLRSIGPVEGGAETVLRALREVAGPAATIVVPTHTSENSVSSAVFRAATGGLSPAELDRYRASMPGFDPATTPSSGMGVFAEYVRTRPDSVRSSHPQTSFAALGPGAADCTRDHLLDCHLGESSPLGWLHRRDATVLLLGVGYEACSVFHLAEYRLPGRRPERAYHCFTADNGQREEQELWDVDLDDSDFAALGRRMDREPFVVHGRVGAASCRVLPVKRAVEFAVKDLAFRQRRRPSGGSLVSSPGIRGVRTAMARQGASEIPGRYFFISYARLSPLPPVPGTDLTDPPDESVRAFFRDLADVVNRRATSGSGLRPGFLDVEVSSGPRGQFGLADELGAAEVFVPLLSPDYYRRSWPRREWASFEQRLRDVDTGEPQRRFAPVLWVPLLTGEQLPGLADAQSLADGAALRPYADYGLCALLRRPEYRGHYEQIVDELGARIVSIAEKAPLEPSPLSLIEVTDPAIQGTGGKVFAVAVMGRPDVQGGAQPAEYARLAAERLGFAVRITAFAQSADQLDRAPAVLLVDPDSVAGDEARQNLDAKVAELPPWVLPVVMASRSPRHPADDRRAFLEGSYKSYRRKPDVVRRGLEGVSSLREFVTLMPYLVTHAEREYLRHGPTHRTASRSAPRPRLADGGRPADLPAKENPDV